MKQGDFVTRKSYGGDIVFKVVQIDGETAILRGVEFRLIADAPIGDLEKARDPFRAGKSMYAVEQDRIERFRSKISQYKEANRPYRNGSSGADGETVEKPAYFELPGKVLHLDGDAAYLRKSMEYYKQCKVPAEGHHVEESSMAERLYTLLPRVKPDILVLTGHDAIYKSRRDQDGIYNLSSYKNSRNFVQAIKVARQYERNRDTLVVIAGACQSHFEALLQAGANFASSPGRVMIHALDPVQIASKVAFTSIKHTVDMIDAFDQTVSGLKGVGGIETRGSYRVGLPSTAEQTAAEVQKKSLQS